MIGIIGGSGIYSLGNMERETMETPYGEIELYRGRSGGKDILFIPRHGEEHGTPPHKVDYKANIWAMKEEGVDALVVFYAAGSIGDYKPGELVLLEDFIGFYSPITYYDEFKEKIMHADMSEPYSKKARKIVECAAKKAGIELRSGGVVATTHGPRFETRAEIKALGGMGANLVNMTSAYEATLAGELGIPLCGIAVATNYAAGVKGKESLGHGEVLEKMHEANKKIKKIVEGIEGC
ncbi:S-methyl-5'-thioadenosine phosphorylase [Candidatus Micrarchaeota archaeon]|nr:S-methyl-5'-thioadenosine phosphorylase [Candidatus Micrarchaeota archaeon]MBD3418013.1 S-methyl-5'-thioadenosine phosphorylase [Candidatus Micrarchaeota archaeon]